MARYSVLCVVLLLVVTGMTCAEDVTPPAQEIPLPESQMPELSIPEDFTPYVPDMPSLEEMMALAKKRNDNHSAYVSKAWMIGHTQAMFEIWPDMLGADFPQDILPLPWEKQNLIDGNDLGRWAGAEIIAGDQTWTAIVMPPFKSPEGLSTLEQQRLLSDFLDHPLGKYYFPDGETHIVVGPYTYCFVSEDCHDNFANYKMVTSLLEPVIAEIMGHCYIGIYDTDSDSTSDDSSERDTWITGYHWDEEGGYTHVMRHSVKDGTPLAAARMARMACESPSRVCGFYDKDSPILLSHRFIPEESGVAFYKISAFTRILPVEERSEDYIYDGTFSVRIPLLKKHLSEETETAFRTGNFYFTSPPLQKELPPEEGVPSADEINATNQAFYASIQPFVEQIAAKIASGKTLPVDICGKGEGDVFYFAIGFEPGEDDVAIDWNLLKTIDGSFLNLPNPYRPESSETKLSLNIADLHAGQWRDIVFSVVDCTFFGNDLSLILGQGPGILCGAISNATPAEMIAGLEKCLEESDKIFVSGTPWTTPSILRWESDEGLVCWTNVFSDFQGEKSSLLEIYMKINETSSTLAYFAQMLTGIMRPAN